MSDPSDSAQPAQDSATRDSKALHYTYRLLTANLWLRTALLTALSLALIIFALGYHVLSKPTALTYLSVQLGTGLLVVAVGAAIVQALIMSAPRTAQKFVDDLQSDKVVDWQMKMDRGLTSLSTTLTSGMASLDRALGLLNDAFEAHDLRSRSSDLQTLEQAGIRKVYDPSEDGLSDMATAVNDPSVTHIQLLGLSLYNWFASSHSNDSPGRALERMLRTAEHTKPITISVQILLLDPTCTAAMLLTQDTRGHAVNDALERLRSETFEMARHLNLIRDELVRLGSHNSLEVRFYRQNPGFFMFGTDTALFLRQYHASRAASFSRETATPMLMCTRPSRIYDAMRDHFDVIWQAFSMPSEEILTAGGRGVDQGLLESGICNIYSDLTSAWTRAAWLAGHAQQRVWFQDISLNSLFIPPLEKVIQSLLGSDIESRFLALDPDSDQAYCVSYSAYLSNNSEKISFSDYCANPLLHQNSPVYTDMVHGIKRILRLIDSTGAASRCELRNYSYAPTLGVLIADDHALVSQYTWGQSAGSSMQSLLQGGGLPLIEYQRRQSALVIVKGEVEPFSTLEDNFRTIFERLATSGQRPGK